ncbi:hypothetical protein [Calidifontibacter indicus]|uniref:hypothetical protein n=1 Tax=Calidifontibacter indicus TaxID=419650 RepID=UPI003D73917A
MAAMFAKTATIAAAQGPRFRDLQPSSSLTVDEPGGDVKKPVPQRFRFACSQDLGS